LLDNTPNNRSTHRSEPGFRSVDAAPYKWFISLFPGGICGLYVRVGAI
jgi:hypothetical protein